MEAPRFWRPRISLWRSQNSAPSAVCPITGRKFYDLNKDPVVSPYTGESYPRSYFEPVARGATRGEPRVVAAAEDREDVADVEVISLEEADAESTGAKTPAVADDIDVDEDIVADGDDDTFLEEDEDDGDDVLRSHR